MTEFSWSDRLLYLSNLLCFLTSHFGPIRFPVDDQDTERNTDTLSSFSTVGTDVMRNNAGRVRNVLWCQPQRMRLRKPKLKRIPECSTRDFRSVLHQEISCSELTSSFGIYGQSLPSVVPRARCGGLSRQCNNQGEVITCSHVVSRDKS
jgi:hypothetical protein